MRWDEIESPPTYKTASQVRKIIEALDAEVCAAEANLRNRGAGGQQVSFHGDFVGASPSVLIKLRWWVNELKSALEAKE